MAFSVIIYQIVTHFYEVPNKLKPTVLCFFFGFSRSLSSSSLLLLPLHFFVFIAPLLWTQRTLPSPASQIISMRVSVSTHHRSIEPLTRVRKLVDRGKIVKKLLIFGTFEKKSQISEKKNVFFFFFVMGKNRFLVLLKRNLRLM